MKISIVNIPEQKNLGNLIDEYNKVDSAIIKSNLIKYIDRSEYKRNSQELANRVGLNKNTIYLYRQPQKRTNVSFETALRLSNVLEVSILDLMKH